MLVALVDELVRVRLDHPDSRHLGAIPGAGRIVALLVDQENARTLYAVTSNAGAQVSYDGGMTWSALGGALPEVDSYRELTLAQDTANPRRLYFAPFASGLWSLDLPEATRR